MNCPKCQTALEDDSLFCPTCGTEFQKTDTVTFENATADPFDVADENKPESIHNEFEKENRLHISRLVNLFSRLVGILFGVLVASKGFSIIANVDSTLPSASFGADFYTYTYRGLMNLSSELVTIETMLGWIIVSIGAITIAISIKDIGGK